MKIITEAHIKKFLNFIESHDFFYIISHKEPDGDAIFSSLAMGALLKAKGKKYKLLSAGPFKRAEIRSFAEQFSSSTGAILDENQTKTALLVLDCSEAERFGEIEGDIKNLEQFVVDHHKTSNETENSIIDPSAPATACIVQQLYEKTVGAIPKEVAEWLFTGLSTDTGYFRFLKEDSAEVFKQASRLVEAGVNPKATYDMISGGKAYSTRKLLGVLLSRTTRKCNGKLAVTYETQTDSKRFGQEGRDSDALYSLLLAVEGVEAVLFVRQDTETTCTAGLRSRDVLDVSAIAAQFGGGGHKNAAGLSVEGKPRDVIRAIVQEFKKVI